MLALRSIEQRQVTCHVIDSIYARLNVLCSTAAESAHPTPQPFPAPDQTLSQPNPVLTVSMYPETLTIMACSSPKEKRQNAVSASSSKAVLAPTTATGRGISVRRSTTRATTLHITPPTCVWAKKHQLTPAHPPARVSRQARPKSPSTQQGQGPWIMSDLATCTHRPPPPKGQRTRSTHTPLSATDIRKSRTPLHDRDIRTSSTSLHKLQYQALSLPSTSQHNNVFRAPTWSNSLLGGRWTLLVGFLSSRGS